MPRIISVVSGKGGVGKTTLVGNLGTILSKKFNKKVLLIDANITTPHLGQYMGIDFCQTTLNDVLRGTALVDEALYEHESGARLIPASIELHDLKGIDISKLKKVVAQANKKIKDTEIVLIDSAPGLGREAMASLQASREVLFITTPYAPIVIDVMKCARIAEHLKLKPLGVVVNMSHGKGHELNKQEIEALVGLPVISTIGHRKEVHHSLSARKPLVLHSPRSQGAKDFHRVAEALLGVEQKQGMFVRLKEIFNRFYSTAPENAEKTQAQS